MTWGYLIAIITKIVSSIVKLISPELREFVSGQIVALYEKAKATDNPWDDFLVELLATILGVDLPS